MREIIREFEEARHQASEASSKRPTDFERWKAYNELAPDDAKFSRRMVDLAATNPKDPAARDALIWVINKPYRGDAGPYGDEFSRAVNLLVKYYADDPEAVRLGLSLNHVLSRRRDAFVEGMYANALSREAKGLARSALASYLERKAVLATGARDFKGRSTSRTFTYDAHGKLAEQTFPTSKEDEGYRIHARMLDAGYLHVESERLYQEVIDDFGDVPYITGGYREAERKARETPSATVSDPKEKQAILELEKYLASSKRRTLGEVAAGHLDELRHLAVGQVAPDFEGTDAAGRPIKLSSLRGKVVGLVFWFAGCGPCIREIPHERELTEKMKGRPFTLLGVVGDGNGDAARKVIEDQKMTWPNLVTGGEKVSERYHVTGYPTQFVIDAQGVIAPGSICFRPTSRSSSTSSCAAETGKHPAPGHLP